MISRRARVAAFVAYALLLFTLTHWPGLQIEMDFERPDLVIHFVAFAIWTALLIACGFFAAPAGRPRALTYRNIFACVAVACVYAALDEASQAIPILNRSASAIDLSADVAGVLAATAGALILRFVRARAQNH